jgi:hypothetical protein
VTEVDWLTSVDPKPMLEFLRGRASVRQLRLFACACCRRIWHQLTDERSRTLLEDAEASADGLVDWKKLAEDWKRHDAADKEYEIFGTWFAVCFAPAGGITDAIAAAREAADAAGYAPTLDFDDDDAAGVIHAVISRAERLAQVELLHDIFGNPFRPASFDPSWRTPAVTALARGIYEERRSEDLPVLADALEEAGCTDATLLGHCRQLGEHVRGCWVVDLALEKRE